MNSTFNGILMIALGILVMPGTAFNWRIISRPGKLLNMVAGDTAARVIYFILGIVLPLMGINQWTGLGWF